MLCSSSGPAVWEGGRLRVYTKAGEHTLFLSYEEAKQHAEWLRTMKDQFLARRKELKDVAQAYAREGNWVLPQKA
jgi:hypothetical protein